MAISGNQTLKIAMNNMGTSGVSIRIPGYSGGGLPPGARVESPKKKKKKLAGGEEIPIEDKTGTELDLEALPEEERQAIMEESERRSKKDRAPTRAAANKKRAAQSERKRSMVQSARGKRKARGTILTGAQGLGDSPRRRKTLLGL